MGIFNESLNVGITLARHLEDREIFLLKFTFILLGKFIGIIPSFIFPTKFDYMFSYKEFGIEIHNYQATTHNYVEMILNFGLLGSIIVTFLCAIILNVIKTNMLVTMHVKNVPKGNIIKEVIIYLMVKPQMAERLFWPSRLGNAP